MNNIKYAIAIAIIAGLIIGCDPGGQIAPKKDSYFTWQLHRDVEKRAIDTQNTKDLIEKAQAATEGEKVELQIKLWDAERSLLGATVFANSIVTTNKQAVLKNDGTGPFGRWWYSYNYHIQNPNFYLVLIMQPMSSKNTASATLKLELINEKSRDLYETLSKSIDGQVVMTEEDHPTVKGMKQLVFTFNVDEMHKEKNKAIDFVPIRFILYGIYPNSALITENDPKLILTHNKKH